jgi:hypothetical protein
MRREQFGFALIACAVVEEGRVAVAWRADTYFFRLRI